MKYVLLAALFLPTLPALAEDVPPPPAPEAPGEAPPPPPAPQN